jgi:hypothetical protein
MNLLKQFYDNEPMREAVQAYFMASLHDLAVERVFGKQTISGVYEAKKVIEKSFEKLEEEFSTKPKPTIHNSR